MKKNHTQCKYKISFFFLIFLFLSPFEILFAQETNLLQVLYGVQSSFRAKISYFSNGNLSHQGKIAYRYPNQVYIQFDNGDAIVSNGKHLWIYDSASMLCAKQEVGGGQFYTSLSKNKTEQSPKKLIVFSGNRKIIVRHKDGLPVSVLLKSQNAEKNEIRIDFSNFQTGATINPALFYYNPPASAQVIENPFKK